LKNRKTEPLKINKISRTINDIEGKMK
jgi:hypothetical protein